jgi:Vanadium chloroperoxidase N-terminal domain/PAP2 superfamily
MNPILYWNAILLECSRRDFTRGFNNAQQPGPIRTSRAMAIVHLALHDAVAFHSGLGAAAYLNKKAVAHGLPATPPGSVGDMIAGAAVVTLKALYPRYTDYIDDSTGTHSGADFNFGKLVGQAMLDHRAGDGSDIMLTAGQPASPVYGQHGADPFQPGQNRLGPVWGQVTRFAGPNHQPLDPFPGAGLPDFLVDPDYKDDFEEVRDYGAVGRNKRSAEQERIGVYWGYDGAMNLGVPPRLYNQVVRRFVAGKTLTVARTAELFAEVNMAMADAGIDAWHYKYLYDLWRPVVGVRNERAGDNDPFWAPLGAPQTNTATRRTLTPNFPAYPSGHATFGAAMFQTLRLALATASGPITLDDVIDVETNADTPITAEQFSFVSDELDGIASDPDGSTRTRVDKHFRNFAEAVWENSVSRIYLGVHWRFDGIPRNPAQNIGGVPLGLAIGVETHDLFNGGVSLGGSV